MTFTGNDELERRCGEVVDELDLPPIATTGDLVTAVAQRLGLTIRLRPFGRLASPRISGSCLHLGHEVVIGYPDRTDPWYEAMTVAHELGHLLCGHLTPRRDASRAADGLLPALSKARGEWQLFRCTMGDLREEEAELVGSLLVAHLERPWRARRTPPAAQVADLLGRERPLAPSPEAGTAGP
jgi:hypothetical protein